MSHVFLLLQDAKLLIGVPYFMAVADVVRNRFPAHIVAPIILCHVLLAYSGPSFCVSLIASISLLFTCLITDDKTLSWQSRMGGNVRFVLPLAPTVSLESLAMHADRMSNPFIAKFNWSAGAVKEDIHGWASLVTEGGIEIEIRQQYPSYEVYKQCSMCLTTVLPSVAEEWWG